MLTAERFQHVARFYGLLEQLAERTGGPRNLGACTKQDSWPSHGVYFFYEPGELRADGSPRVVRVGTHALQQTSRATLWKRLSQHRGNEAGGGNHRGSIFRKHVGSALIKRAGLSGAVLESWLGKRENPAVADEEARVEQLVSAHIRQMPFLWLKVPTSSDGTSLRGYVERNCIALLSDAALDVDSPSSSWLGHDAASLKVRESALWNVNHVDEKYESAFLDTMRSLVTAI